MVERTLLDARCYICGHLISGPVTIHTDRGQAHPSCVNCSPAVEAELVTLRAKVEKAERERDQWRNNFSAMLREAAALIERLAASQAETRRLALEEAARVAKTTWLTLAIADTASAQEQINVCREETAAAILALINQSGTEGGKDGNR